MLIYRVADRENVGPYRRYQREAYPELERLLHEFSWEHHRPMASWDNTAISYENHVLYGFPSLHFLRRWWRKSEREALAEATQHAFVVHKLEVTCLRQDRVQVLFDARSSVTVELLDFVSLAPC